MCMCILNFRIHNDMMMWKCYDNGHAFFLSMYYSCFTWISKNHGWWIFMEKTSWWLLSFDSEAHITYEIIDSAYNKDLIDWAYQKEMIVMYVSYPKPYFKNSLDGESEKYCMPRLQHLELYHTTIGRVIIWRWCLPQPSTPPRLLL